MSEELVKLTIEGVEVSVPRGTTVIEAAKEAGINIPHYCYHKGLPIAGVCRMCLVQIEGAPKLQISCATEVAEGQVVRVFGEEESKARSSVLEFLLINHPLDCPICDQSGECELQDFTFDERQGQSRYNDFPKRYDPAEQFGDDVMFVANRCILCTRCVRFMDHAAEEPVLNVSERGDRAFIGMHPDAELNHPWAGNVVDLCPVGSLISKDFLHKARVWELDHTDSICTGCSQGCNIHIDTREELVVRLRPRANEDVNKFFMCDEGRSNYRWLNSGDRIEAPLVAEGGSLVASGWDHALARVAQIVKGSTGDAVVLASGKSSNESLFFLRELFGEFDLKAHFRNFTVDGELPLSGVEGLALREERIPNGTGARQLGYDDSFNGVSNASIFLILGDDLEGITPEMLSGAKNFIYVGTTLPEAARNADVVLPATTVAEEDGTYVNRDNRVQRFSQARTAPGMGRPAWWAFAEVLKELGRGDAVDTAAEAFDAMASNVGAFNGMSYSTLGKNGQKLAESSAGVSK